MFALKVSIFLKLIFVPRFISPQFCVFALNNIYVTSVYRPCCKLMFISVISGTSLPNFWFSLPLRSRERLRPRLSPRRVLKSASRTFTLYIRLDVRRETRRFDVSLRGRSVAPFIPFIFYLLCALSLKNCMYFVFENAPCEEIP